MAEEWLAWTAGPLLGAVAGGAAAWLLERAKRRRDHAEAKATLLTAKVQDHEVRIAVLGSMADVQSERRRGRR